jgi:poly(3-hydroxybutyrate) depolymerase
MHVHTIAAQIHGRYLVDRPDGEGPFPLLVGFHGYAERAEHMLEVLQRIRGERAWLLVSVQALNRFYTRSQDVVGNWMTREDRELAIADNVGYVAAVVAAVRRHYPTTDQLVYAGFSQGVAMAYRALAFAAEHPAGAPEDRQAGPGFGPGIHVPPAAGGILLAGDVPPDVAPRLASLPALLIGRGDRDDWYTGVKAAADGVLFAAAGITPEIHVFDGGHVWGESFIAAAGQLLDRTVNRSISLRV